MQSPGQHQGWAAREPQKGRGSRRAATPPARVHSDLAYLLEGQESPLLSKGLCGYGKVLKTTPLDGVQGPASSDLTVVLQKRRYPTKLAFPPAWPPSPRQSSPLWKVPLPPSPFTVPRPLFPLHSLNLPRPGYSCGDESKVIGSN